MLALLLLAAPAPCDTAPVVRVHLRLLSEWQLPSERAGLAKRLADGAVVLSERDLIGLLAQMQGQVEAEVTEIPRLRCSLGKETKPSAVEGLDFPFVVAARKGKGRETAVLELRRVADGDRALIRHEAELRPGLTLVFQFREKLVAATLHTVDK